MNVGTKSHDTEYLNLVIWTVIWTVIFNFYFQIFFMYLKMIVISFNSILLDFTYYFTYSYWGHPWKPHDVTGESSIKIIYYLYLMEEGGIFVGRQSTSSCLSANC